LPGIFAVTGVNFPLGVLIYWLTTNVWSMGQQFFIIRNLPAAGTEAATAREERKRKRGKLVEPEQPGEPVAPRKAGQRQPPARQDRQKQGGQPKEVGGPSGTAPSGAKKPQGSAGGGNKNVSRPQQNKKKGPQK